MADAEFLNGRTTEGVRRRLLADKSRIVEFDSWDSFTAYCEGVPATEPERASSVTGSAHFCETDSWDDALTLARAGWREQRGEVDSLRDRVKADPAVGSLWDDFQPYPTTYNDVAGAFPDVAAFLTGDPHCMVEFGEREEPRSGRVVRILVDGCYSGGTQTDVVIRRGAVVVALCEILESLGFSTDIRMEHCVTGYGAKVTISNLVTLKTASQPLDSDALMFALAHPSSLRRLGFRANEHEADSIRGQYGFGGRFGGGYGSVANPATGDEWDAHVVLHSASAHRPESQNPEQWIREIVTGLFSE